MIRATFQTRPTRILDFDIETVAAGFADPDWVPQKVTCVAWSWVGSDTVESTVCGPAGIFGKPGKRVQMLKPFLKELAKADVVTGHNITRFDLPVLNAEVMRLRLPVLGAVRVQDTMKLARSKGFKKGQDVLGRLFRLEEQKLSLNWQDWQDAYDEAGWPTIRERAESDVLMHKELREELLTLGYLKPIRVWSP
jgi:DNA polymerase elongation subunit (family B)